jgi:hypothetical protein
MVAANSSLGIRRPAADTGHSGSYCARRLRDRQDGGRLYRSVPEIMDLFLLGHRDSASALAWIIHEFAGEKRKGALKD